MPDIIPAEHCLLMSVPPTAGNGRVVHFVDQCSWGRLNGPVSYPTGGFVVDFTGIFTSKPIESAMFTVAKLGPLNTQLLDVTRNSPVQGKVLVKVLRILTGHAAPGTPIVVGEIPSGTDLSTVEFSYSVHTH